ncbi:MAG TPA: pyridoxal-phosphate dependent enzyme [Candidatus Nanoarchaeia archaeon]|nr:pyridoxal-phosphate dependent enzyme [Candidatus Nanoarchaeia archaeon]
MEGITREKIGSLREKLAKYPKVQLSNPTPIEHLRNVSDDLGLEVIVSRLDKSGPGYGGHYSHALEYVFGEIVNGSYDSVVHGGPSQSNQNLLIAAACARYGLKTHLVLRKKLSVDEMNIGNIFLDQLCGADIKWVTAEMGPELDREKEARYREILREGKEKPYLFERQRVAFLSCLGMLDMFLGIYEQLDESDKMPSRIYLTGCGPTHSGILLGSKLIAPEMSIVGVTPLHWDAKSIVSNEFNMTAGNLGEQISITPQEVVNYGDYVGKDYGIPTKEANNAIKYFANREGIFFDPVYTGKMAACFLDHARNNQIPKDSRVLIIHSGGTPLLLLYAPQVYGSLGLSLTPPKNAEKGS